MTATLVGPGGTIDVSDRAARVLGVVAEKGVLTAKATYTAAGASTLVTPPAGQRLRVEWLYAQAKGALDTGVVLVTFTLGANSYEIELTGSQPFAHGAVWEGGVNEALVVNTSSAAAVLVNVDYRVFG